MFSYRDMTFCSFYKNCKNANKCGRALTPQVFKEAKKWMKDPPICQFTEKPDCWIEKNE